MTATNKAEYKTDAKGNLVKIENIRDIDLARDDLVKELVAKAKQVSKQAVDFKQAAIADIIAFVDLSAERYGVKIGGTKGNVTLTSFDGQYRITHAVHETMAFDEGLQAAKALIDECLNDWTEGVRPELHALINQAFDVDKQGNINTQRVLSLRRLKIEDERWQRAMSALSDSVQSLCSKAYIRVYERDNGGNYRQLALDVASA